MYPESAPRSSTVWPATVLAKEADDDERSHATRGFS